MVQVTQVPGVDLMRKRADVLEGAAGSIDRGKARLLLSPVDMEDLDRAAGDVVERMEHDEAGAVGEHVGLRLGDRLEGERAVGLAGDLRVVDELALARPCRSPR